MESAEKGKPSIGDPVTIAMVVGARPNFMKISPIVPPFRDGKSYGRIADVFLKIPEGKEPSGMDSI